MDNLKEKAKSSVAGMGKALKGTILAAKRKESISSIPQQTAADTDAVADERRGSVAGRIPHSPSLPASINAPDVARTTGTPIGSSRLNLRDREVPPTTSTELLFPNYRFPKVDGSDPLSSAYKVFSGETSKTVHTNFEEISLEPLLKLFGGQPAKAEFDEPWEWRTLSAELMASSKILTKQLDPSVMSPEPEKQEKKSLLFKVPQSKAFRAS